MKHPGRHGWRFLRISQGKKHLLGRKLQKKFFKKTTPNLSERHMRHSGRHGWRSLHISQGKKHLLSGKLQKNLLKRQLQIC